MDTGDHAAKETLLKYHGQLDVTTEWSPYYKASSGYVKFSLALKTWRVPVYHRLSPDSKFVFCFIIDYCVKHENLLSRL